MASHPQPQKTSPAPAPTPGRAIRKASRDEGIAQILQPGIDSAEGIRVLIYGRTRYGKSTFARSLIDQVYAQGIAHTIVIHDVKYPDRQQYPGAAVSEPIEMLPALESHPVVVCRPPYLAADAAAVVRGCVEDLGEPCALVLDESRKAIGKQQRWIDQDGKRGAPGPRNFEWLTLEAGGLRGSMIALIQLPRSIPIDLTDSSTADVVFGLQGKSLRYLVRQEVIPVEAEDTIRNLAPGEFCIFSCETEWDRTVYYSPLITSASPAGG